MDKQAFQEHLRCPLRRDMGVRRAPEPDLGIKLVMPKWTDYIKLIST